VVSNSDTERRRELRRRDLRDCHVLYRDTWASIVLPPGSGLISSVSCATSRTCIATAGTPAGTSASFIESTNGGRSWSITAAPSSLSAIDDLSCSSATDCVAVGQGAGGVVIGITHNLLSWKTEEVAKP
jgi:photosystem II stability/assembly factor-like uncharacterized protein